MPFGMIGSIVGGLINAKSQRDSDRANIGWNKELATNQYQYRVADMKKAGLHPSLAAGTSPVSGGIVSRPNTAMGDAIANAGQQLSNRLQQRKQNELLDAQIENIRAQTADINANTALQGQAMAGTALQTDQQNPSQTELKYVPQKHTQSPMTGMTVSMPDGQQIKVTPGVYEYLNELKTKYGMEEAAEIIGAWYFARDFTKAELLRREAMFNERSRMSRKQRRGDRKPGYSPRFNLPGTKNRSGRNRRIY